MQTNTSELPIDGAHLLAAFSFEDLRGSLSKYLEKDLCSELGFAPAEVLISSNRKNAIRGLHYQHPEAQQKIVWCTKGEVLEVLLDMRRNSPTYGKWHAMRLSASRHEGAFVPAGVAHGFSSLGDSSLLYLIDGPQIVSSERGVRFDDPALGIGWQIEAKKAIVSEKDRALSLFKDAVKF